MKTPPPSNGDEPGTVRKTAGPPRWMGVLTAVVLVALLVGFWRYSENLIQTLDRQATELSRLRETLADMESVLGTPLLQVIPLESRENNSTMRGVLFWNSDNGSGLLKLMNVSHDEIHSWIIRDGVAVWVRPRTLTTRDTFPSWRLIQAEIQTPGRLQGFRLSTDSLSGLERPLLYWAR